MLVRIQHKDAHKTVSINRRKAIRERCLQCAAWSTKTVTECRFSDCDLWPFRDGQGKQEGKARSHSIRRFCLWCMNGRKKEVRLCPCRDCPLFPYRGGTVDRSVEIGPPVEKQATGEGFPGPKQQTLAFAGGTP